MAKIHQGATLVPHFRDFLPEWVARQEWYVGTGIPSLTPVGYFRFEDPAGAVGVETHLVTDGAVLYQRLGVAIANARARRGALAPERVEALDALGMRWS